MDQPQEQTQNPSSSSSKISTRQDTDDDTKTLLARDNPPKPDEEDGYLKGPPENWRSRCPLYPWHCLFHLLGKLLGGAFTREPEDMMGTTPSQAMSGEMEMVDLGGGSSPCCQLTPSTQKILRERVFHDLDPSEVVDYHVHIVGHGDSGSNCYIHNSLKTWWSPLKRLKAAVFMAAAQVPDEQGGDKQYISRLLRLVKQFVPSCVVGKDKKDPGYKHNKLCLLAFDAFYEKDGQENRQKTTFYIPNDYAFDLAEEFPQYFYAVGSVNPYRNDALQELDRCASKGVSIIKWLPNSMGIDLRDEQCVEFYKKLKELDMALLVHVGEEHAVDAAFLDNSLGNPLHLRKPLKYGVKVIAAHCGTEGYGVDFETEGRPKRPCYELFIRLMKEDQYKDLLFGDISAVCGFKRVEYLAQLIEETDIHDRLVYGSDYPVPAINIVVHTSRLQKFGLITAEEKAALNELYTFNPLLFDLACKRLVRSSKGTGFPTAVFKEHRFLPPNRKPFTASSQGIADAQPKDATGNSCGLESEQQHPLNIEDRVVDEAGDKGSSIEMQLPN